MKTKKKLQEIIYCLRKNGFSVALPHRKHNERPANYAFFSINNKLGYFQIEDFTNNIHFSTVHKGCLEYGTGFRFYSDFHFYNRNEKELIELATKCAECIYPLGFKVSNAEVIRKYKGLKEYFALPINQIIKYNVLDPLPEIKGYKDIQEIINNLEVVFQESTLGDIPFIQADLRVIKERLDFLEDKFSSLNN